MIAYKANISISSVMMFASENKTLKFLFKVAQNILQFKNTN